MRHIPTRFIRHIPCGEEPSRPRRKSVLAMSFCPRHLRLLFRQLFGLIHCYAIHSSRAAMPAQKLFRRLPPSDPLRLALLHRGRMDMTFSVCLISPHPSLSDKLRRDDDSLACHPSAGTHNKPDAANRAGRIRLKGICHGRMEGVVSWLLGVRARSLIRGVRRLCIGCNLNLHAI